MKKCLRCLETKSKDSFYKMKGAKFKEEWDCRDSQCIECRKQTTQERRIESKRRAVEYLGGACADCGLVSEHQCVYDFHHLDPSQKDFSLGANYRSFESAKSELDKCVLLCSNCHRIRHYT